MSTIKHKPLQRQWVGRFAVKAEGEKFAARKLQTSRRRGVIFSNAAKWSRSPTAQTPGKKMPAHGGHF